jgi:Flp pilus assembly pilin Flp
VAARIHVPHFGPSVQGLHRIRRQRCRKKNLKSYASFRIVVGACSGCQNVASLPYQLRSFSMKSFIDSTRRLVADRRGITAIEYAVLAAGISVALAAVFSGTGIFDSLETRLKAIIGAIGA